MPAMQPLRFTTTAALVLSTALINSTGAYALPDAAITAETLYSDQIIAELPRADAAIASVALARLVIILHDAKRRAAQTLCHGNWPPRGEALHQFGPMTVGDTAGETVWLYHSVRRAHALDCGGVSRGQFFLEMSRHLPAWIRIRPAGGTTTFKQGSAHPAPDTGFAGR